MSVSAEKLVEGVHYEVIDKTLKATPKPEIKEFFSFYCPHCYTFEPLADRMKENAKNKGYKFQKSHVDFLRAAGPDIQFMLTKATAAADVLKKPQVIKAIFDYIQKQRGVITEEKDIKNIFLLHGVTAEKFDKVFNSFAVTAAAKKMKKEQNELSRIRALTGVPTFIVNGKYKIINNGFKVKTLGELFDSIESASEQLMKLP